ncbi:MAG: hypothetical protein AB8G22_02350 [Saprospiraceae bacterium]
MEKFDHSDTELSLKEKILEAAAVALCILVLLACFIKVVFI